MPERGPAPHRAAGSRERAQQSQQEGPSAQTPSKAEGPHGGGASAPPPAYGSNTATKTGDPRPSPGKRAVVRRAPWREVGIVNAPCLLDHGVEHESWLERRFIHVALASPVVTDIHHQPETVDLMLADGSAHSYTPDFRVHLADGTKVICEVKPATFVKDFEATFAAAKVIFQQRGEPFLVITDRQIDNNSRSARALLLMRYGRLVFSPAEAEECKRLLEEEMAGSAYVQQLVDRGVSEHLVWHMVASHMLRTKEPLNISPIEPVEVNTLSENCLDHFERWFGHPDR